MPAPVLRRDHILAKFNLAVKGPKAHCVPYARPHVDGVSTVVASRKYLFFRPN